MYCHNFVSIAPDVLADSRDVYALCFEGKVYDVDDKDGFLKAISIGQQGHQLVEGICRNAA